MNNLCECANLEWKETDYHLEHHPDCKRRYSEYNSESPLYSTLMPRNLEPTVWKYNGNLDIEGLSVNGSSKEIQTKLERVELNIDAEAKSGGAFTHTPEMLEYYRAKLNLDE